MMQDSFIDHYRRSFSGDLPSAELEYKLFTYSSQAKKTFDPSKNASYKTHLDSYMSKMKRDIHNSHSTMKVSEGVGLGINKIKKAKDEFYMVHGTTADTKAIAKATGLSPSLVKKYDNISTIRPVMTSEFQGGMDYVDVQGLLPGLKGREKLVAETISQNMSTKKALSHTNMSQSTYYRNRDALGTRMKEAFIRTRKNSQ